MGLDTISHSYKMVMLDMSKETTEMDMNKFASHPAAGQVINWLSWGARQGHYSMDEVVKFCASHGITFQYIPFPRPESMKTASEARRILLKKLSVMTPSQKAHIYAKMREVLKSNQEEPQKGKWRLVRNYKAPC